MEWISVDKDEPKEEEHVLLFDRTEGICVGYIHSKFFNHHPMGDYASGAPLFSVTHWMPLPEPPEVNDRLYIFDLSSSIGLTSNEEEMRNHV